jgi:hypothetical protein
LQILTASTSHVKPPIDVWGVWSRSKVLERKANRHGRYFSFVLANVEGVIQVIQENLEGLYYMLVEHFKRILMIGCLKIGCLSLPKELGRAFIKEMDTSSDGLLTLPILATWRSIFYFKWFSEFIKNIFGVFSFQMVLVHVINIAFNTQPKYKCVYKLWYKHAASCRAQEKFTRNTRRRRVFLLNFSHPLQLQSCLYMYHSI